MEGQVQPGVQHGAGVQQPQGQPPGQQGQPPGQQPPEGGQGPLEQPPQGQAQPDQVQVSVQNAGNDQNPDDQVVRPTETKQKTKRQQTVKPFHEMPPFTVTQILSNKEFQHLTFARIVTTSKINDIIEWFHSQV